MTMEQKFVDFKAQLETAIKVIIIICIITSLIYAYKYYLDNDGKGIDDIFYLASISTLHAYFGLMAFLKSNESSIVSKRWLFAGTAYCILVSVYVKLELTYLSGVIVSIIPALIYLVSMFIINSKHFLSSLRVAFVFSFITSVLPIYAFITLIFSIIVGLITGSH